MTQGTASSGPGLSRIPQDLEAIERVVLDGPRLVDLRPASPFDCSIADHGKRMTSLLLRTLYPGHPLLCCDWTQAEFDTRLFSEWKDLWTMQFIVPNPMSDYRAWAKAGHLSAHTLDNTGPRRFLVIECDFSPNHAGSDTKTQTAELIGHFGSRNISVGDICAGVILHLATFLPLVLVVASGGKSLHGWFYCCGQTEADLLEFMRYAIQLGADWRLWLRSQFVRMPDGTRDNGNRQLAHYFDPRPLWKPDCPDTFLSYVIQACRERAQK